MSGDEGSLGEIWTALGRLTRRLDELGVAIARLEPAGAARALPGDPLDETARARLAELESLLAVGPRLALADALVVAVDRVIQRAGADCVAVFVLTPEGQLNAVAHRGFTSGLPKAHRDEGIVGRALADRESIRGDVTHHDRDALLREHGLHRALAIPIPGSAESPLGVLFAGRRRPAEFGPEALDAMVLMADRLALLLGRSPMSREPGEMLPGLIADLDLGRTAALIAREAARVLGAPRVAVLLPDEGGLTLGGRVGTPPEAAPPDPGVGAIAATLRTREPWVAAEGETDESLGRFLGAPPRLVVPLVAAERLVGLLAAGGPQPMTAVALAPLLPQAAAAILNARLHAETVAALAELRSTESRATEPGPPPARDFANLLAVVLGRLAAVRERVGEEAITRDLDVAEEAAWRAAEAVRGLLGFAPGHRVGALTPLDVTAVIRATVERGRRRWAAREETPPTVQLEFEPLPPVRGSGDDLREAFDHLLENAAEAASDGGAITIRARWDGGPRVEVMVEDHGGGMDERVRARALEPFFSTKGPGRLGLGLPVAQAIVAHHRGELEIVSAPGLGTTVRVTLPTVAGGRRPTPEPAIPVARVLVVEDEASVREALVEALSQQGHVALTAADGREALAIVQGEPIDAVVTDLALPGGSGLEVARAVKRARAGTPVILVTAWPGGLDAAQLQESGVDAVIEKPVGLAEIRAALAAALARRAARRT